MMRWPSPLLLPVLLTMLMVGACSREPPAAPGGPAPPAERWVQGEAMQVEIAGETFLLELALDSATRHQGLSDRPVIPPDAGMLFVFPDAAERTFVMRRCLVPIDLIYLDSEGRIISMHEMEVEPYGRSDFLLRRYPSRGPARFVIELAEGSIRRLGLSRGEVLDLELEELKARAR